MQTYSGHIEAGRFYSNNGDVLPDSKEALLVINVAKPKNIHAEAWRKFFGIINASEEELSGTIERVNFVREISI